MRKERGVGRGAYGSRGRGVAVGGLGLLVLAGVACSVVESGGDDGGVSPDATTTTTTSGPPPTATATSTGTGAPDAAAPDAAAPVDAAVDAEADATDTDATADATTDAADGGSDAVLPGSEGILRGLVGGLRSQDWTGRIRLPNATCPAGATTVTSGAISCCSFGGAFGNVARIPVVFDLTTRSGTLAGAPIGPLSAPIVEADGTMRFQAAAFLEGPKAWQAGIEMARTGGSPAGEIAEATRMYENPALMRAVSDSLKYMVVTWNPTTMAFRIRFELTNYQATAAGTCGIPGGQETFARLAFDLR